MKATLIKLFSITANSLFIFNMLISTQNLLDNFSQQHPWTADNIRGYSIDPITNKIDETEGFGAFDSITRFSDLGPRNFDNGGGSYDDNTDYLKTKYKVNNVVYDPFKRNCEHNLEVVKEALNSFFDTCTSISVLNVIDQEQSRLDHIKMCFNILKPNGKAFFKVWPGNNSGQEIKEPGKYQSNKGTNYYIDEIKKIFGDHNVVYDQPNDTIISTKT